MQPTDFSENRNGELIQTAQGYWAFVPRDLPPKLDISWELAGQISHADRAMSELSGITRTLPNPHLLIAPFVKREAVLSSRIEGTRASLSDLFFFMAGGETREKESDVREVANYVKAMEYGLKRLEELPLSLRLIREIHRELMEGVRGETQTPGEFRRTQNWIGPPGCMLSDATYVPPPVPEMNDCLDQFEKFLHAKPALPVLVRLAAIHYQFEAIHPFLDGNGRIGRLLITLVLCGEKVLPGPVLYLSAFFEKHRDDYYRRLLNVSMKGEWKAWIQYFLKAVETQSQETILRANRLLALQAEYRDRVQTARSSALLSRLVDLLFESPVISVPFLSERFDITQRAAQQNVDKLIASGILREITGRSRNRMYAAEKIIATIEDALPVSESQEQMT
jgi:Fic family protein